MNFALFFVFSLTACACQIAFAADADAASTAEAQDVNVAASCADCPNTCWKGTTCLPIQCLKDAAMESFKLATAADNAAEGEEEEPILSLQELRDPTMTEESVGAVLLEHLKPLQHFREGINQCLQLVEDTSGASATTSTTTNTSNAAVKNLRKKDMKNSDEAEAETVPNRNMIPYFGVSATLGVYLSRSVQVVVAYNPAETDYGVFAMMCTGVGTTLEASAQPVAGVLVANKLDAMVGTWHKVFSDYAIEPMEVATSVAVGIKNFDYSFNPLFQDLGVGGGQSANTCNRWRLF